MKRAEEHFKPQQVQAINLAVAQAEANTSVELVPVVATSSGRYDRPEDVVGLWCAMALAAVVYLTVPSDDVRPLSWSGESPHWKLIAILCAVLAGFILGATLATHISWLRRLCTPHRQMIHEVTNMAKIAFGDNRIHHHSGKPALMLYVSLYERMAIIRTDETIAESLGRSKLDRLAEELTYRLQHDPLTDAICKAIHSAGQSLAEAFPGATPQPPELPDCLITID